MRFHLDESGSTGDVARTGDRLDFGGQPIFVLAAIGVADEAALALELRRLASRHGVLGNEISSTSLVGIPLFAGELAEYLRATDSPVFVEMMEKRFLIVINMVNRVLLPPIRGFDDEHRPLSLRTHIAEVLAAHLTDDVLVAYANACDSRSRSDLDRLVHPLMAWARQGDPGGIGGLLVDLVSDFAADLAKAEESHAHVRFLPEPDPSVTGRLVSMLPGLSALTNIYARINKHRGGDLAGVIMVHDEHMLFGNILSQAKAMMERLSSENALPRLPNAEYRLRQHAELTFASSHEPGIQAADVIAGFVMRFFRDAALGRRLSQDHYASMNRIMQLTFQREARGINMVAADGLLAKAGIR